MYIYIYIYIYIQLSINYRLKFIIIKSITDSILEIPYSILKTDEIGGLFTWETRI